MFTKAAILFFVVAGFAAPQDPTGSISGMVQDSSGALVPGVQVTAESIATGFSWSDRTDERGSYTISGLPPGLYRVVVRLAGFTPAERPVRVGSGIPTTAVNFKLEVGKVEAQIDVPAVVPLLREGDSTVGSTVQYDFMKFLPVNGLNPLSNVRTAPSVREVMTNGGRNFVDIGGFAHGGGVGAKTHQAMDGVSIMSVGGIGSVMSFSQEATEEIRISTTNFPPSTGATLSGVVSAITRSGGNDFHGGGSYLLRDHNFDAFPALDRNLDDPDPFFQRRQAGLNVSGPILRNRVFAFGTWDHNEQRGVSATKLDGPDFKHLSRITTSPSSQDLAGVKVDGMLPKNQKAFLRYSYDDSWSFAPPGPTPNAYPSAWLTTSASANQAVLGVTGPLSSAMINEFRVSYFWTNFQRVGAEDADCPGCLGVGKPQISIDGLVLGNSETRDFRGQRFQLTDSVTVKDGTHYAVFGFDWQRNRGGPVDLVNEPASFTLYSPEQASSAGIPVRSSFNTFEDILSLPFRSATITVGDARVLQANGGRVPTWNALRLHFHDKWQAHPSLTVNYGVAWSIDRNLNYDLTAPRFLAPVLGEKSLAYRRKQWKNFAPVAGFTWRPPQSERTLFRAGAALYYDFLLPGNLNSERVALGPAGLGRQTFRGTGIQNSLQDVPNLPVGTRLDFPAPTLFTGANFMTILEPIRDNLRRSRESSDPFIQQIQVTKTGDLIAADFPAASALHVDLGFTRQLTKTFVLDADFVLKRFDHLGIGAVDLAHFNSSRGPLMPKCGPEQIVDPAAECLNGSINVVQPAGRATYKGLLVQASQQFSGRLRFIGSWAYSSHIGTHAAGSNGFNLENWHENRGPLPTDLTHIFNLAAVTQLPRGFQLGLNYSYWSTPPFSAYLEGIDLNGDGNRSPNNNRIIGDLLPGTTVGVFNRGMGREDLERLVEEYNRTKAGTLDPFGKTLKRLDPPTKPYWFNDDFQALDLHLSRSFKIEERSELRLSAEVFNVFNIANLSGHSGDLTNPSTFGKPTARSSQVFGSGGPRAFQFGVEAKF